MRTFICPRTAIESCTHPPTHLLEHVGSHPLDLLLAQAAAPGGHRALAVLHLHIMVVVVGGVGGLRRTTLIRAVLPVLAASALGGVDVLGGRRRAGVG